MVASPIFSAPFPAPVAPAVEAPVEAPAPTPDPVQAHAQVEALSSESEPAALVEASGQPPERSDVQPSAVPVASAPVEAKRGKAIVKRASGVDRRRTTIYFSPELARRLAVYCAGHDLDLSDATSAAVEAWLASVGA